MMTTKRGNAAEAAVLAALVGRGFDVLVPFGSGQAYDLVVDLGPGLLRVQCKTARASGGCLAFNARSTDHGRGAQSYRGVADLFGVYFPDNNSVYLIPIDDVAEFKGHLRLLPTRNNQSKRVRFAADFEVDRWSAEALRELVPGRQLQSA